MKVQAAMALLESVKLTRPRQYIIERNGYDEVTADQALAEYRKFIALTVAHPGVNLPTCKEVDDFWHAHILCSHDYLAMCETLGVAYIHHNPCLKSEDGTIVGCYNRDTLGLYRGHFGEPHAFWTADQELCNGDNDYCNSQVLLDRNVVALELLAA